MVLCIVCVAGGGAIERRCNDLRGQVTEWAFDGGGDDRGERALYRGQLGTGLPSL